VKPLAAADWERFLAENDQDALLTRIREAPSLDSPLEEDFPYHHRICDINLRGIAFRITRLVELEIARERLFAQTTDVPNYESIGVPYWLQGPPLLEWIRDEVEAPSKSEVSWASYGNDLPEIGTVLDGTVYSKMTFGLFVRLPGGHNGLVQPPELGDDHPVDMAALPNIGDPIRCVVLALCPNAIGFRVALSVRPSRLRAAGVT
jgi:hypothetical protein